MKTCADNKINRTQKLKSVKERVQNIVGNGENTGYQHFLLFPQYFQKAFFYPITRRQILDSSELKDFADDNVKFDKNGRKLSKPVENTVGKGETACYEQFLLFPQCFQKACFLGVSKGVIVWEWVKGSYKVGIVW